MYRDAFNYSNYSLFMIKRVYFRKSGAESHQSKQRFISLLQFEL